MIAYTRSVVGYSHVKDGRPCQDCSLIHEDETHQIVAVADGHGGAAYIRSDRGSRFACEAVKEVFKALAPGEEVFPKKVKLQILCAWNALVERDYGANPFTEEELAVLDEDIKEDLLSRPERAYGTTLMGAAKIGDVYVIAQIGDGESVVYKDGKVSPVFDEEDEEPVANVTYSMCNEDVLTHLHLAVIPADYVGFVLLCTDGVANPYQSYDNFCASLVKPILRELSVEGGKEKVDAFMDRLASTTGIGDDVSLGVLGLGPILEEEPEEQEEPQYVDYEEIEVLEPTPEEEEWVASPVPLYDMAEAIESEPKEEEGE